MKIWILNHYATRTPENGGGGRHYYLARELVKKGYEVMIIASGFSHYDYEETQQYNKKGFSTNNVGGINYCWIKTFPYNSNSWRRIVNMLSYASKLYLVGKNFERPDLIIASSMHPFTWISGYLLARRFGCRFVSEVRDLWPETAIQYDYFKRNSIPAIMLNQIEKFIYYRSEKIIVLLPGAIHYVSDQGISSDKVVYLPNGADEELYKFDNEEAEHLFNEYAKRYPILLEKGKFKILYTGSHGLVNILDLLLSAAQLISEQKMRDIHFILIGTGPEKDRLIETAKKMNLDNVSFADPVPRAVIPYILNRCADLCIELMPDINLYSKFGVSPNKLFDYIASGKPVIMVGNPFDNLVLKANCGVVVKSEKPEDLVSAIIQCSQMDKTVLADMGNRGRQYFQQHHTYKSLADKLEQKIIKSGENI